jgi:hypothetical protein
MIGQIVESTMRKALLRLAKENGTATYENQIIIGWNAEQECLKYYVVNKSGSKQVTFNEILGVKFDLMNREFVVSEFITKKFDTFSKTYECEKKSLFVYIFFEQPLGVENGNEDDIKLCLYKGANKVKDIELEELFLI